MLELLDRERREKITTWELGLIAMGRLLGVDVAGCKRVLQPLVESITDEVTQKIYDMDYLRGRLLRRREELLQQRAEQKKATDEHDRLFGKLTAMGK